MTSKTEKESKYKQTFLFGSAPEPKGLILYQNPKNRYEKFSNRCTQSKSKMKGVYKRQGAQAMAEREWKSWNMTLDKETREEMIQKYYNSQPTLPVEKIGGETPSKRRRTLQEPEQEIEAEVEIIRTSSPKQDLLRKQPEVGMNFDSILMNIESIASFLVSEYLGLGNQEVIQVQSALNNRLSFYREFLKLLSEFIDLKNEYNPKRERRESSFRKQMKDVDTLLALFTENLIKLDTDLRELKEVNGELLNFLGGDQRNAALLSRAQIENDMIELEDSNLLRCISPLNTKLPPCIKELKNLIRVRRSYLKGKILPAKVSSGVSFFCLDPDRTWEESEELLQDIYEEDNEEDIYPLTTETSSLIVNILNTQKERYSNSLLFMIWFSNRIIKKTKITDTNTLRKKH